MNLTLQQESFVVAYTEGPTKFNGTQSAIAAAYSAPAVAGSKLLATVKVRQAIQARLEATRIEAGVPDDAEILRRLHALAWADPNELSQNRVRCCRHCHGTGFAYQWRSEQEWAVAVERELAHHEAKIRSWSRRVDRDDEAPPVLALPNSEGGFDFDAKLLPVEGCPNCDGDGVNETVIADTRFLSPAARLLYAGVKRTKDGIEVKMHDQLKARELLMRHRGLLNDKLIHIMPGGAGAIGVEADELSKLSIEQLAALEDVHAVIMASREEKQKALAAPDRPPQHGEITDV